MLIALITLRADEPWMAMLQFEHARGRMKQNRNIEIGNFFVERQQHFAVEVAVAPAAVEFHRFQTKFFHRAAKLFYGLLDVGQINPCDADEAAVALNILSDRIVIGARQPPPQLGIALVNQRPVVRYQNLHIETVFLHELGSQRKIPAAFFERMNLLAVAIIGCHLSRHDFAVPDHLARVFGNFEMPFSRMIHLVDEA